MPVAHTERRIERGFQLFKEPMGSLLPVRRWAWLPAGAATTGLPAASLAL